MSTDSATQNEGSTRGRPRKFNDDAVIDAMVQLFWTQGYEATSMADIVAATGLNKSSLYSSFGSKDELFEMALNRYVDTRATMLFSILEHGTTGLADITTLLDSVWSQVSDGDDHRGCLAVNASTELGQREPAIIEIGSRYRADLASGLRATFSRAAELGEIDLVNIETYTVMIASFLIGTAVNVRAGATNHEIRAQLDAAQMILDMWRRPA
jgi:AcrR family transcriptional regulator